MDEHATNAELIAWVSLGTSVVLALLTAAYVILTNRILNENRLLRQVQIEPCITAHLEISEAGFSFINLVIQNQGPGPAVDVDFTIKWALGEVENTTDLKKLGIFQRSSAVLPSGWRIECYAAKLASGNYEQLMANPIEIIAQCHDRLGLPHQWEYVLDFEEFRNLVRIGRPSQLRIAQSLEQISKSIGHFATGFKKLKVTTTTEGEERAKDRAFVQFEVGKQEIPEAIRERIESAMETHQYQEALEILATWERKGALLLIDPDGQKWSGWRFPSASSGSPSLAGSALKWLISRFAGLLGWTRL